MLTFERDRERSVRERLACKSLEVSCNEAVCCQKMTHNRIEATLAAPTVEDVLALEEIQRTINYLNTSRLTVVTIAAPAATVKVMSHFVLFG